MINLADFLAKDRLIPLAPASRDAIVHALLDVCLKEDATLSETDRAAALGNVRAMRDQALGKGFALTHARIARSRGILISAGLFRRPAPFGHCGPTHTVFCALIPEEKSREYLSLIARLSRLLSAPDAEEIFQSGDPERIHRFIREFRT